MLCNVHSLHALSPLLEVLARVSYALCFHACWKAALGASHKSAGCCSTVLAFGSMNPTTPIARQAASLYCAIQPGTVYNLTCCSDPHLYSRMQSCRCGEFLVWSHSSLDRFVHLPDVSMQTTSIPCKLNGFAWGP